MRMKARVISAEEVVQAAPPSSKPWKGSGYVAGDRRHCTMELFELDGKLPLKMMVGSVVLLEVQPVGLLVGPSRTLQVHRLRFEQAYMLNFEPVHMRSFGQVSAVELVPRSAEEEHTVWSIVSVVQKEGQPAEVEWAKPVQRVVV